MPVIIPLPGSVVSIRSRSWLLLNRLLLVLAFFLRQLWRGEIWQGIAPDVMIEPCEIVLHHRAHRFWFRDAVAIAFVNHHLDFHAAILQALSQFVSVGDGHAAIEFAVLNQRWRLRVL